MMSKLILGTVQFGLDYGINNASGKLSKSEVFDVLLLAKSSGIKVLDTADQYGNAQALIGEFNRSSQEKFLVNTKFKVFPGFDIEKHTDDTLRALSVDFLEVYFYHSFDDLIRFPEFRKELVRLKMAGKVRGVGVSVYTNEEIEVACNIPEIDVIQLPFNLLDNRSHRGEHLIMAKRKGKIIQARSVFLQGLFFKAPNTYPDYLIPLRRYVEEVNSLSDVFQMAMEDICLSYVLSQPEIDQVIIGIDSREHLKRNLCFAGSRFNEELVRKIDDIKVLETDLLHPVNWK